MKRIALLFALVFVSTFLWAQSVTVTANLPGRKIKSDNISIPEYDFSESGIVVVGVEVDKDGKVIKANVGANGTTLMSGLLWTKCRKAAQNAVFEERNTSEELQAGTISYAFYTEKSAPQNDSPRHNKLNPLAGSDLPDSFSLLEIPIDFQGARSFKIFQVITKDAALAESEEIRYGSFLYGDPIVLLVSDKSSVYYDDLVIRVEDDQRALQLGTFRYENRMGTTKTVPIVMIVKK